jgi:hypothetical protein
MNSKPSRWRRAFYRLGCILVGYFALTGFFIPTAFLLKGKLDVAHAMDHAKSIRLEHFEHVWMQNTRVERIIAAKNLAPEDFHRVSDAFSFGVDISVLIPIGFETACMFNPHHRILIKDAKGNVTVILVCFECDHYQIGHGDIIITPFSWQHSLRRFFREEGMPEDPQDDRHQTQ